MGILEQILSVLELFFFLYKLLLLNFKGKRKKVMLKPNLNLESCI